MAEQNDIHILDVDEDTFEMYQELKKVSYKKATIRIVAEYLLKKGMIEFLKNPDFKKIYE